MTDAASERSSWIENLPMQYKLIVAMGLVLVTQLLAVATFRWVQREQSQAVQWSTHTYQVLLELEALSKSMREQQNDLRGYLLVQRDEQLDALKESRARWEGHFTTFSQLTRDNPTQQQRLLPMRVAMDEWARDAAEPAIAAAKRGASRDELLALTVNGAGRRLADQLQLQAEAAARTERSLLDERDARLDELLDNGRLAIYVMLAIAIAVGLLAIVAARRMIIAPLLDLTTRMTRLADHDHAVSIPMQGRRDEVGQIARALEVFKRMAIETWQQNWIKTHTAEVSTHLQQTTQLQEFGDVLVSEIAPVVEAAAAAFYQFDEHGGRLELKGRYARGGAQAAALASFALGEGLVGQCAVERKPLVVTDVPAGYLPVQSGLGQAAPRTVVLLPVLSQAQLVGVLELALFGPFETLHQRLFDSLLPIVALSLEKLERALRTQMLLEETQTQSEELRASEESLRVQQEELRATNDELSAQSARLQASEEELKVQAEELQAANEELTQKSDTLVQQKNLLEISQQEIEAKAAELARSSQYKSDFLANMSHELRTPLNSLLILSRSLADNELGHLDGEEVESAQIIHESGANLLRLINDILDLSKVEAGKLELVIDALAPAEFVQRLQRTFRSVAKEKNLELGVEVDPELPALLHTDGARLEQIANNLIGNAFKFTRRGSVTVRFGRPALNRLLPAGLSRDAAVALSVTDTGIGIPPDKLGKLFQAFEQVDAGTSRQFGGTGLGLAISRRLAQLLGGDIVLDSVEGEGSTFTLIVPQDAPVTLTGVPPPLPAPLVAPPAAVRPAPISAVAPAIMAPAPAPAPAVRAPPPPAAFSIEDDREAIGAGDTVILIVEDDPTFARILADLVRRKHYKVLAAADGESGLALARQYKPTGVLLDVMLPGMDGWTVIDKLKTDSATRHIPVHFISATDEQARALEAGAVGFLTKPVSRQDIGGAFDRLLHFAPGAMRRVLIVDDDPGSRHAVRTLIADDGVDVVETESAEAALAALEQGGFDCIVLDLGLPGMSGFEFLERASQGGHVPPVVVHSGKDLSREDSLKLRQYTDSIVIKGVRSPERLLDEVSLFLHSIRRDQPAAATPARNADPALANRTVLVVDDDMRNIFALSKTLRARGLKVLMAQDGHKALKQLADNADIDIVLMDIMMPGMDGYETTREIRKQPKYRDLPVLALTAKAMQGDREKCLEAGANDYLSKPIDIDKLLSMMRVYVR